MAKDYEVGRGKPPKHSRFKAGQSGNPKGRPRSARNLKTLFNEERRATVTVREGGRELKVTKLQAIVMAQFAKAMRGDPRAAAQIFAMYERFANDQEDAPSPAPLSAEEQEVLKTLEQRFLAADSSAQPEEKPSKKRRRGGGR